MTKSAGASALLCPQSEVDYPRCREFCPVSINQTDFHTIPFSPNRRQPINIRRERSMTWHPDPGLVDLVEGLSNSRFPDADSMRPSFVTTASKRAILFHSCDVRRRCFLAQRQVTRRLRSPPTFLFYTGRRAAF
jgi:hypothetical protein